MVYIVRARMVLVYTWWQQKDLVLHSPNKKKSFKQDAKPVTCHGGRRETSAEKHQLQQKWGQCLPGLALRQTRPLLAGSHTPSS